MSDEEIIRFPSPTRQEFSDVNNTLRFACEYTRAILDDSRIARPNIGSGILVGIGDRLFVASAAHCIYPNPFLILTQADFRIPCNPTTLVNRGRAGDRDIGFLEIENDPALPRLPVECLCPDPPPISTDPLRPAHRPTCVVGFPVDEFVRSPDWTGIVLTNFGTYPLRVSENEYQYTWPLGVGRYQTESDTILERDLTITPRGFSGGGVWAFNEPPSVGLTLPQHLLSLYSIQSRWEPVERVLKCIPIRWWLNLVYDRYPDLRESLAARFPFLRQGVQYS